MSQFLIKDTGGGDFELPEAGNTPAICDHVIDLGMQASPFGLKPQLWIGWQLPAQRYSKQGEDGREYDLPMPVGKFYTASLSSKANLYTDLVSWRGREFTPQELQGFDIYAVLGVPCMLSIVHKKSETDGKMRAKIQSIGSWEKGRPRPTLEGRLVRYHNDVVESKTLGDAEWRRGRFEDLDDWLRKKIMGQADPQGGAHSADPGPSSTDAGPDIDDEIPF